MELRGCALGRTSAGPALIALAGAAFGLGVGLACCPPARTRLRRTIETPARALTLGAKALARRMNDGTAQLTEPGAELAKRIRIAARAGVREVRRHLAVVQEPSRERLAGVEGLAECL